MQLSAEELSNPLQHLNIIQSIQDSPAILVDNINTKTADGFSLLLLLCFRQQYALLENNKNDLTALSSETLCQPWNIPVWSEEDNYTITGKNCPITLEESTRHNGILYFTEKNNFTYVGFFGSIEAFCNLKTFQCPVTQKPIISAYLLSDLPDHLFESLLEKDKQQWLPHSELLKALQNQDFSPYLRSFAYVHALNKTKYYLHGIDPAYCFASSKAGRRAFNALNINGHLSGKIIGESLCRILPATSGCYENTSTFYWLCSTEEGQAMLLDWLVHDEQLATQDYAQVLCARRNQMAHPYSNASALLWLCVLPGEVGLQILTLLLEKNPQLARGC